jgi:ankyrin repeat protein
MDWRFFEHLESQNIVAENIIGTDSVGRTSLHWATIANGVRIAKALIEAGVDIDVQDHNETTALHLAVLWDNLETGKILIEAGADLYKIYRGQTALEIAERNRLSIAILLRKKMGLN